MSSAAAAALPPTRILSSTTIEPSDAHTFLSAFIAKADADRHTPTRGDLVLADQRRIEKALQGIFIPKPQEALATPEQGQPAEPQPKKKRWSQQEEAIVIEYDGNTGDWAGAVEDPVIVEVVAGGVVDKEKRKAEKKARAQEEKKRRAEERKRGKQ